MTELNLAYSFNNEDDDEMNYQPPQKPPQQIQQSPPQIQQPPQQIQQTPQQIPQQVYKINHQQHQQQQRYPEYSFWDRMVLSRGDVMKLFILSLVVVIGISIEKLGCHYMTSYITSNDLSNLQEFLVRLSLPIFVILLVWIIKSF